MSAHSSKASMVEVRFEPEGATATRVEVEHRAWPHALERFKAIAG